ncbi:MULTISPECIES: hypothetical protein [unclassified Streptomyces]|uniref:hypothetical protein n=1 Tax=unclassified Streptomyces TaxID=2593676 RepID=UPI000A826BD5|nr:MULTISPECIES: hypothetical protein [unclassified Streptomyces]MCX5268473.1 hypothetical protein [Streptomyces sp. NBC_00199]MDX3802687.1 hypothetical protein [Streptomyces sp. AK04-3B]
MPATEPPPRPSRPLAPAPVSMRDLLASCAAAEAVSTPPRLPDPALAKKPARRPRAA